MLVMNGGRIVFEDYVGDPTEAHRLASGTKSFWGVLAAAASADGYRIYTNSSRFHRHGSPC